MHLIKKIGGTEQAYSFVDFNPAGDLLASVGCAPDYMLTVWSWKHENIMLRSKVITKTVFCALYLIFINFHYN